MALTLSDQNVGRRMWCVDRPRRALSCSPSASCCVGCCCDGDAGAPPATAPAGAVGVPGTRADGIAAFFPRSLYRWCIPSKARHGMPEMSDGATQYDLRSPGAAHEAGLHIEAPRGLTRGPI